MFDNSKVPFYPDSSFGREERVNEKQEKSGALSHGAKADILTLIAESGLRVDEALPTEAKLMKLLGVSRHTVREALALLEQERVVYRIQGKGTFLKRKPLQIEHGLEKLASMTDLIKSCGLVPSTRWIGIEVKEAGATMARQLLIGERDKVVTFKRLRLADGNLASYCVDSMSVSHFDSIPYEIEDESVFRYLEREKGIYIETAVSYVIPTLPTHEMVRELGVEPDQLFILLEQLHYDNEGNPVIYSLDYFQPDVIRFRINRTR